MSKLILTAELRKALDDGRRGAEVVDESGKVVGYYLPADELQRRLDYAEAKAQVTKEELDAAMEDYRKNGGVTTAEVLDRLRKLDIDLRGGR